MPDGSGFDNRAFWERRYTTDPATGSGAGSRGRFLVRKQALLTRLLAEYEPRSVLDVGCGDIEVARSLPFDGSYTGVDLSPSVLERNRELRPGWTFLEGDFLELADRHELRAELVLALDVLIHQHDPEVYRAFVRRLVKAAERVLVVNGFDTLDRRPGGRHVAFHEPLSRTLAELGAVATPLERFRLTRMFLVQPAGAG